MDYFKAGLVVGATGDLLLQYLAANTTWFNDLTPYFEYQGKLTSVVKAALLTGFWSGFYAYFNGGDNTYRFALFAGAVDILYRYYYPVLYPSLEVYYNSYPFINTVLANMGVAVLVQSVARSSVLKNPLLMLLLPP
jgi:hypothetical protein